MSDAISVMSDAIQSIPESIMQRSALCKAKHSAKESTVAKESMMQQIETSDSLTGKSLGVRECLSPSLNPPPVEECSKQLNARNARTQCNVLHKCNPYMCKRPWGAMECFVL